MSNTTSATNRAGTDYPIGTNEFTFGVMGFSFLCGGFGPLLALLAVVLSGFFLVVFLVF